MEFGMFHQFPALPGRTEKEAFEEGFEQIDAAELGIDGILAELNCGGLVPHQQVMTALQLLCQEVKPRFH